MSRSTPTRRPVRAEERGSVLIFVVGVLLLLAIIATAFLGSSRSDRTSTQQNAYNVQIELLFEGVKNSIFAEVLADARFQKAANNYDSLVEDRFLASRVPITFDTVNQADLSATPPNMPVWSYITAPLLDSVFSNPFASSTIAGMPANRATYSVRSTLFPTSITIVGQTEPMPAFVLNENAINGTYPDPDPYNFTGYKVPAADTDGDGVADAGLVKLPVGTIAGVTYYYAARIVDMNSAMNVNTAWAPNNPVGAFASPPEYRQDANFFPTNVDLLSMLAGLDGNAQSTQMNLLNGQRTGLGGTQLNVYAGARDDNANEYVRADFNFAGPLAGTQTTNFADALWNQLGRRIENPGYSAETGTTKYKPFTINDTVALVNQFVLQPNVAVRTALDTALERSLITQAPAKVYYPGNPYNVTKTEINWFNENFYFQPYGTDPTPDKPLRAFLTASNGVGTDDNVSVKAALPASGKVEPIEYRTAANPYQFGDVVSVTLGEVTRNYVCLQTVTTNSTDIATTGNGPLTVNGLRYWGLLSWTEQSQKIPANTADFGEMWWGFRRLMAGTIFGLNPAALDRRFAVPPFPTINNDRETPYPNDPSTPYKILNPTYTATSKARQFRNPIRDANVPNQFPTPPAGTRSLTPSEVLQLRSAIAAVNAIDLRDGDSDVTGRQIQLYNFGTPTPTPTYNVTVFGSEMQPYITEVYVNNDIAGPNPNGYIAVELYNPYNVEMVLNGWSLGMADRSVATPTAARTIESVFPTGGTVPNKRFEPDVGRYLVIPANSYVVLENFNAAGAPFAGDATVRPAEIAGNINFTSKAFSIDSSFPAPALPAGSFYVKYIPGLSQLIGNYNGGAIPGKELILLRPRQWRPDGTVRLRVAAGDGRATSDTANFYATTPAMAAEDPGLEIDAGADAVNLGDWVPVDSFDFYNINQGPAAAPEYNAWHYARDMSTPWKWTHGIDRITPAPMIGSTRQGAVMSAGFPTGTPAPAFTPAESLGAANAGASFTDTWGGTQINNEGWPSSNDSGSFNAANPQTGNRTPFGAFAQETDLFRIPFIGAYTVRAAGDVQAGTMNSTFTEMNSLPIDFSFGHDDDEGDTPAPVAPAPPNDNAIEQVGRFTPLSVMSPYLYRNWDSTPSWTTTSNGPAPVSPPDWYDFGYFGKPRVARTLTDIFTARSPLDDGLPNVAAETYSAAIAANPNAAPMAVSNTISTIAPGVSASVATNVSGTTIRSAGNLITTNATDFYRGMWLQMTSGPARGEIREIDTVATAGGTPEQLNITLASAFTETPNVDDSFRILGKPEDTVPTQGLININTASWQVLSKLPLAFNANGTVDHATSELIAKRIVTYRDGDPASGQVNWRRPRGPFKSLLDLNKVLDEVNNIDTHPAPQANDADNYVQTAGKSLNGMNMDYAGYEFGDLSNDGLAGQVPGDFENRLLALSRISNLITTRSDAFVAYIVLQGWRDAGTPQAKMVSQRRAAFIIDRSAASVANPSLTATKVPSN